ncbi:hypothetical protein Tco_0633254, partial [Tanacetum coccineum]
AAAGATLIRLEKSLPAKHQIALLRAFDDSRIGHQIVGITLANDSFISKLYKFIVLSAGATLIRLEESFPAKHQILLLRTIDESPLGRQVVDMPIVNDTFHQGRAFWSLNEDILKITVLKTNTPYPSRRYGLRMTKVIKGEFKKLEDLKVKDVSLTCDTSLEVFNNEFNRLSGMDDDLFTYEVEVANILCDSNKDDDSEQRMSHEADDDMGYDPSDIAFSEWLGSKNFNYKTMDHYTKKVLWIYWIRGDNEVELMDNEDEVAETYLLRTLRDSKLMMNIRMIGSMNGTKIYHGLMKNHRLKLEFGQNQNQSNILASLSTIKLGVRNGQPVVGERMDTVMEALEDSKLKDEALRNKAIMEGLISDDESSNDCWKRRKSHEINYHDYNEGEYENKTHKEGHELCGIKTREVPVCQIKRYKMIKYSFNDEEEYVAIKEDEYNDNTTIWEEQAMMHAQHTRKSFA